MTSFIIIGLGGVLGHQTVERVDIPARVIDGFQLRRPVAVAQWQKAEEPAQIEQRVDVVFEAHRPPLTRVWVEAPPSSSWVMSSWVTVFTTSRSMTNMYEVSRTMKIKSVLAGE